MIRARSVPLTTVLILTTWNIASAQTDLDFEQGELLSEAWGKRGSAPHNFDINVDSTVSFTGERSGHEDVPTTNPP